jgi:mRNA interferase MazF
LKRGDLYRVRKPKGDPRSQRVFVIVSRQVLVDSRYSTVICAPVYSKRDGLATQVDIGPESGLKQESCIHCDELVSLPKNMLTDYVGALTLPARQALAIALKIALEVE